MSIQVENLGALKRKVRIVFPFEEIAADKLAQITKISKNFSRPGFRRGKVPLNLIEKELGEDLNSEAAMNRAAKLFFDICKEQKILVAGRPDFNEERLENKAYGFDVSFEVLPSVPVLSAEHFESLQFKDYQCAVDEQEVDRAIALLQKMLARVNKMPADHLIGENDRVTISMSKVSLDGEEQERFFPLNEEITIDINAEDSPLKNLFKELIGKAAGDHTLNHVFDAEQEEYADHIGKNITATVTVSNICEVILAEVNEDFFKKLNANSLEELREDMRKNLELQVQNNLKTLANQQITKAIKLIELDVPEVMIKEEQESILNDIREDMKKKPNIANFYRLANAKEEATDRLKLSFLFSEFIQSRQITITPEQIRNKVNEIAASYENPAEIKRIFMQDEQMIKGIQTNLLEEQGFAQIKEMLPNKDVKAVTVTELSVLIKNNERQKEIAVQQAFSNFASKLNQDDSTDEEALESSELTIESTAKSESLETQAATQA